MENLKNIEVTGEISLQPYDSISPEKRNTLNARCVVLILGPTGAGKSSVVEAFAGPSQKLSLSSNQLAGYTQHINAFRVANVKLKGVMGSIHVVDTPGFSDSKFSEKEILDVVNAWLHRKRLSYVRILYVVPINGTRLPGTQRRTLEMLKTFLQSLGSNDLAHLTFVTTMWDMLHTEGALSRGQSNFEQLRDKQLKQLIDDDAKIVKFRNTRLSAIQVLDAGIAVGEIIFFTELEFRTPELYRDLCERIENALHEKRNIEDDMAQPEAQTNVKLRNLLEKNLGENDGILTKFMKQFTDYGDPPEGFEDVARRLRQEIDIVTNRPRQTQSILPNLDSTDPDVSTPVQPMSTTVMTAEHHASFRASLKEIPRRTLEGLTKPWKKRFGPKH